MNRLYVGNLSYSTTDEGLRAFFSEAGDVTEAEIVIDRATGRSKGFAFVTMATDEAAQNAINNLNGQSLDNRALPVNCPYRARVANYQRDGPMCLHDNQGGAAH